jgi:hypothetical protein
VTPRFTFLLSLLAFARFCFFVFAFAFAFSAVASTDALTCVFSQSLSLSLRPVSFAEPVIFCF